MNNEKSSPGDYAIGYCKPPKSTQFQKGKSGNAKGRPRKEKAIVHVPSLLEAPVLLSNGDQMVEMHPIEAGLRKTVHDALVKKKIRPLIQLIKHFETCGLLERAKEDQPGGVIVAPPGLSPQEWIKQQMEKEQARTK